MSSSIDITKPADNGLRRASDIRTLAIAAKTDIEALQAQVGNAIGQGVSYYLTSTLSDTGTYDVMSRTPDNTSEVVESVVINNSTGTIDTYIAEPLGRTGIAAGEWIYDFFLYLTPSTGITYVTLELYKRAAGGTETLLFSVDSPELNNTVVVNYTIKTVQPAFTVLATDRLVLKVTATTNHNNDVTVSLVHSGTDHYSRIVTPLAVETSQSIGNLIAGSNEKTTPVAADVIAISDSEDDNKLKKFSFTNLATWFSASLSTILADYVTTTSFSDTGVTSKLLTGFSSGAGTISATDTILQAFNKLVGNKDAANGYVGLDSNKQALISCNSTGNALEVRQIGTGNAFYVEDAANPDATPFVIDSGGKIISGSTIALTASGSLSPFYQSIGNSQSIGNGVFAYINSTASGNHIFAKSKSNTIGTHVIGATDDVIGNCRYDHSDGTNFVNSAIIRASIDASPSAGIIPGRVSIYTADLAGSVNERLRVNSNGSLRSGLSTATGTGLSTTISAKLHIASSTYTDSTTATSGTVTHGTVISFDNPAIAATNTSVTYTNLSTVYIDGAPTAGTNVTITNQYALYVAAGTAYFGGNVQIGGIAVPTLSSTDTLTNKRITNRVGSTTSSATPTINTDNVDVYKLTAQTVDITSFTTNLSGTPTDWQMLIISITGTAARAITWGASFESSTITLPTTTVTTATLDVTFRWNAATSKWRCVGVA